PDDPLFVAESQPALNADQNGGRHFEVPQLMRQFGLILENVDGFEDLTSKFVLRGVPHVFALGLTIAPAPTIFDGTSGKADRVGWSGDGAPGTGTLREFAIGAITQHLTRTLDRVPGVDFRLPTDDELDAIEAFLLSLGRPADLDLSSLVLKDPDAKAGLALFNGSGRCSICHLNAGAMIGVTIPSLGLVTGTQNANFDTGVEDAAHPAGPHGPLRPRDGGFGTDPNPLGGFGNGTFNTPSLVEAASSPPFFHNNLTDTIEGAVAFYSTPSFNLSPAALFFLGPINLLDDQTNQVAAFLRVINALEKIRSAQARLSSTLGLWDPTQAGGLLQLTIIDLNQAVRVLQDAPPSALRNGGLHPDAQADLGKAIASCNAGSQTGYQTKRDPSIKLALGYLDQARRDMLVLPPLRSNSLRPL
ncbi:MAG TPA: hypothetical protein VMS64_20780, partial [Candidatus Methylomirabilis sp.]|nr:hypothetical protein [Candidatus Methylomirabilis sp.]